MTDYTKLFTPPAYLVVSVGIIVLGLVHIVVTPRFFPALTSTAVWFASGGLAIILIGALNLLLRVYGEIASGLRVVCVAANVVMTTFALLASYAGRASALEFVFVLGLMGGATLFSLIPAAQRPARVAHA